MKTLVCDEERFFEDTKGHKMTVIRDDGVNRHLRFNKPGTYIYGYDIITWPEHLCITGDCGTYVFSRVTDMFEFFRMDERDFNYKRDKKLSINPGYWGEKLLSIDRNCGYEEFSDSIFEDVLKGQFEQWEFENEDQKSEVWDEIEHDVLMHAGDGEHAAYEAGNSFISSYGHEFYELWDHSYKDFTWHFLWNLYAIVQGIKTYDELENTDGSRRSENSAPLQAQG